ncbi:MAG: Transcription factor FapR [Firmicutes bacterium ADurb.Bin456]|nr:MAG: Transcription factor FapR [Firmicutes bacterium ADurb.Bin456]
MTRESLNKIERQRQLARCLDTDPFLSDVDLSRLFKVSIQTIRLDRLELKIPELRERLKTVARGKTPQLKSMTGQELVGELVDLKVGISGISLLPVTQDMTLRQTRIVRGHHLFAQANSLAVAIIDAEAVVTGLARVSFKRPVYCGEKIWAKAVIKLKKGNKYMVKVTSQVKDEIVFLGRFLVFTLSEEVVPQ